MSNIVSKPVIPNRLYSPAVCLPLLPFLDYPDITLFFSTSRGAQAENDNKIIKVSLERIERSIFSRIEIFDRKCYQHYYGVEITDAFDPEKIKTNVLREFLKTLYGPNPIGPGRVKDGCLIPTVVPKSVRVVGRVFEFNLQLLEQLAIYSGRRGGELTYWHGHHAIQYGYSEYKVKQDCIVFLLKDLFAVFEKWPKQVDMLNDLNIKTKYGCKQRPCAIFQLATLFANLTLENSRDHSEDESSDTREKKLCSQLGARGWACRLFGRTRDTGKGDESKIHIISGINLSTLGIRVDGAIGNCSELRMGVGIQKIIKDSEEEPAEL